ncbi:hypothetical protein [Haloterrigena salina]|uniref:hypothetical protein n=1 Tax=Haloterrigena salina TaxID=504937 RepID=UPI0012685035|nr:hypothetical protein [Haloterrigena salina]
MRLTTMNQTAVVSLAFLVVTVLLTWPILLQPGQIYLTAPAEYEIVQSSDYWYVGHTEQQREDLILDHHVHMGAVEEAAERLRNGRIPYEVDPDYALPPSYVFLGGIVLLLSPLSTIVVHNSFFVVAVFLAGVFTFLFVYEVLQDREVAFLAGVLYMSSFYVFGTYMLGHTNQWQIQWIPLILFAVERLRTRTGGRTIALLAGAFGLQVLSSEQYTVYLSFVLPLYLAVRSLCGARRFRRRSFAKGFAAALIGGVILSSPYLVARGRVATSGATTTYSIATNAFWGNVVELWNLPGVFFAADAPLQFLFRLVLLFLGTVAFVTTTSRRQRQLLPFVVLFGVGLIMAWGPFSDWAPYAILYRHYPLLEYFRTPYRMLPFALLGTSTLSAATLLAVTESGDTWTGRGVFITAVLISIQLVLVHYSLQFTAYSI